MVRGEPEGESPPFLGRMERRVCTADSREQPSKCQSVDTPDQEKSFLDCLRKLRRLPAFLFDGR
jgi:hypothetical protein